MTFLQWVKVVEKTYAVGEGSMSGVPAVGEGGNRSDVSDSTLARTESGDPANNRSVTTCK